jgi:hypothetical protein
VIAGSSVRSGAKELAATCVVYRELVPSLRSGRFGANQKMGRSGVAKFSGEEKALAFPE